MWQMTWSRMNISHVFGFPLWEAEVASVLRSSFGELISIFAFYGRSGTAGFTSTSGAQTLQQTELITMAHDCGLETPEYPTKNLTPSKSQIHGSVR